MTQTREVALNAALALAAHNAGLRAQASQKPVTAEELVADAAVIETYLKEQTARPAFSGPGRG